MCRSNGQPRPPDREIGLLTLDEAQHPDAPSPNAMMVDQPDDFVVVDPATTPAEEDSVAIVTPDSLGGIIEQPSPPLADDCT
jgi:hypothetical protein